MSIGEDGACEHLRHAMMNDSRMRRVCQSCEIKELEAENAELRTLNEKLKDTVKDWEDDQKSCMDERCGDEKHCTCVPALRRELKSIRTLAEKMAGALKPFAENYKRYGNHYSGSHDMFMRVSQALSDWEAWERHE